MLIKMIYTTEGHCGIILKTRRKSSTSLFFVEDDSGILFVQDENRDLCSFMSVRKVHEVNHHKGNEKFMVAYRNAGWMSP